MKARIDMIGVITENFQAMHDFYKDVMGFEIELKMDSYVEFKNDGVRFAISTAEVMAKATSRESYRNASGHRFELAFRADSPEDVDSSFTELIEKGAKPVKEPADMPWSQRTAFFEDPDGNIHEIFADLPK